MWLSCIALVPLFPQQAVVEPSNDRLSTRLSPRMSCHVRIGSPKKPPLIHIFFAYRNFSENFPTHGKSQLS